MGSLRVGSLNINGGRDRQKREMVKEIQTRFQKSWDTVQILGDGRDWSLKWRFLDVHVLVPAPLLEIAPLYEAA
ncbi:MAG: hypothetical protein ACRCZO_03700, partial [Cetobacterium sp.]